VTHVVNCRPRALARWRGDLAAERAAFGPGRVAHAPMQDHGPRRRPAVWAAAACFAARVSGVQYLSGGFLIVPVPAGTPASQITVGTPPAGVRLNDTDPTIVYNGFNYSAGRGLGDYDNDVHYATANGSTAALTFTGTGIAVYGEQYTDQGNIGISIDGGAQQTVSTVPSDGQRHSNVAVYTATGLSPGNHTIVVTKLSGTYSTLDGFNIIDS
jgi:hypothetical protein